jgi:hypothetical protein
MQTSYFLHVNKQTILQLQLLPNYCNGAIIKCFITSNNNKFKEHLIRFGLVNEGLVSLHQHFSNCRLLKSTNNLSVILGNFGEKCDRKG